MRDSGHCALCNEPIWWVQSLSGNVQPIDPNPVENGELTIICGRTQPPLGETLTKIYGPAPRFRSHVRTCKVLNKKGKK